MRTLSAWCKRCFGIRAIEEVIQAEYEQNRRELYLEGKMLTHTQNKIRYFEERQKILIAKGAKNGYE